jgi:hypothetical protein
VPLNAVVIPQIEKPPEIQARTPNTKHERIWRILYQIYTVQVFIDHSGQFPEVSIQLLYNTLTSRLIFAIISLRKLFRQDNIDDKRISRPSCG